MATSTFTHLLSSDEASRTERHRSNSFGSSAGLLQMVACQATLRLPLWACGGRTVTCSRRWMWPGPARATISSVLLYVHRNRRLIRDGEPRTSTSTFTQLLSSVESTSSVLLYVHRDRTDY